MTMIKRQVHVALILLVLLLPPAAGAAQVSPPPPGLVPPVSMESEPLSPWYTGCGNGVIAPVLNASYEQQVVDLVNTERANRSLPPLKRVMELDNAARYHSTDLGQDNYFDHDSYDRVGGNLVLVCAWSARISSYYSGGQSLAENIAAGYSTPSSVMNGWMNSTGHRNNILSTGNWEIGVGYYQGSGSYGVYWTQDFGRRSNVYPLIINRDAATTDSRSVSIHIYNLIYGSWQEMRLRNDAGSWSNWQPFQSDFTWTLPCGQGNHTVTVELRSGSTTATSSDSITLTTAELPALGNLPSSLTFLHSVAEQRLVPSASQLTPADLSCGTTFTWTVASSGDWFSVAPLSGTTLASFWITPTNFTTGTLATYTGVVMVTVTSPPDLAGSPHRIDLMLEVIDSIKEVFLPIVLR